MPASDDPGGGDAPTASAPVPDDQLWSLVIERSRQSPSDAAKIEALDFIGFDGGTLRVRLREDAVNIGRFLSGRPEVLEAIVERAAGRRVKVQIEAGDAPAAANEPSGAAYDEVRRLPLVQQALDLFDARIIDVQDHSPAGRTGEASQEDRSDV